MKIKSFAILLGLLVSLNAFAGWKGTWQTKGSDALIGLSTEPSNPDIAKNSYLIIGYTKSTACLPVVSVLIINGQKLGSPIKQKASKSRKNQLVVKVNGQEFTADTKLTEYANGMELAMYASNGLIQALSSNSASFSAYIGSTTILEFEKANSFTSANSAARSNCK